MEPDDPDVPEIKVQGQFGEEPRAGPEVQARLLGGDGQQETLAVIGPRGSGAGAPAPEPFAAPEEPESPRFRPPTERAGRGAGEAFAAALDEPASPFTTREAYGARPVTPGLAHVRDVSIKALLAIERAADAVQTPDTARSLKEHKREIQNVLALYSMDSELEMPRDVQPVIESPSTHSRLPEPQPQYDNPEMRYMVNDLKDLDRDRYAEAAALRDSLSSRSSSVAPYPPDEGGRSSRVSEASSGAILSAHVSYARNIRHRVRGDDPERAMEYSEEEAEADKAYCQRIRRQLRYTFGGPLDPIDETPTPLPGFAPAAPGPPPGAYPAAPPAADNWASQMIAELEVRPRPVYASAF